MGTFLTGIGILSLYVCVCGGGIFGYDVCGGPYICVACVCVCVCVCVCGGVYVC